MTDWRDLVGERVLVKMSQYATGTLDRIVTNCENNYWIQFDNEGTWYDWHNLELVRVHKSKKYPGAWTWE